MLPPLKIVAILMSRVPTRSAPPAEEYEVDTSEDDEEESEEDSDSGEDVPLQGRHR